MSQQWRVLVVEGDEYLNQDIVNSLLKDGYNVQGVLTGADAIRILWVDEQNLVIGDLRLPDADGIDLLKWIRTYRPQTRMIMLAAAGVSGARSRALENGAVGYLEKPVDLLLLKVEVRRLLQQTGFTASLASFDLLDVIQIVNMSRKSIALVVHTGLEEQGMLGFQTGELIWAEYGILRGEEAFFALAAHKNGMVTQQSWNEHVTPNVVQPLSRLIMQALQYRSKYAAAQQLSGEIEAVNPRLAAPFDSGLSPIDTLLDEDPDDRPFTYVAELADDMEQAASLQSAGADVREWWQDSAKTPGIQRSGKVQATAAPNAPASPPTPVDHRPAASNGSSITPSTVHKTPTGQRSDLPSWLMDQPTQSEMQVLNSSSPGESKQVGAVSPAKQSPAAKPQPAEWRSGNSGQAARRVTSSAKLPAPINGKALYQAAANTSRSNSAEWQVPQITSDEKSQVADKSSAKLQSLAPLKQTDDLLQRETNTPGMHGAVVATPLPGAETVEYEDEYQDEYEAPLDPTEPSSATQQQSVARRNYPALVSALQTLGYTLSGFIASAIVGMDGQPIAQVAVEDLDISEMCGSFSDILRGSLHTLQHGNWGQHEDTIITSVTHHILLRVLDNEREVFQVLVTTRESDPVESLAVMSTVESAIVAAL